MIRAFAAIVLDTFREARARRVYASLVFASLLGIAAFYWMMRGLDLSGPSSMVVLMSQFDPRYLNRQWVARGVFGQAAMLTYALQLLVCLLHIGTVIPGLLETNRNAWLAAHPFPRAGILLARFLGCFLIALGAGSVTFAAAWVITGLKTNVWHAPFFFGLAASMLVYASFSAAMMLLQLIARSPALMGTGISILAALNIAASRPAELAAILGPGWLLDAVTVAATLLPRPAEIARLTDAFVQTGALTGQSHLWASAVFGAICLTLASWRFARMDL